VLGFVLVMVATVLLFSLVSLQLAKLVKLAGLTGTDRMLGAFFGLARGLVISVIAVLIIGLTPLPQEAYWREAMFRPPLEAAAGWMRPWLPASVHDRLNYE
jgi:membrane protein required for colicin V production